ncbi:hypothetical protein TNCV_2897811 [Trichonephila clavipes]|nr:hypothetical protein TNCV_2897811 [Trichonephila clavipes]
MNSCQSDGMIGIMEAGWPKTPLTGQSLRRPWNQTTRTHSFKCRIDHFKDAGITYTTCLCVLQNHRKASGRKTYGTTAPSKCSAKDIVPPIPPFRVVPRTT